MVSTNNISIYKKDDTAAFGGILIRIYLHFPDSEVVITKAAVSINFGLGIGVESITKNFTNPTSPIDINLTGEETKKLQPINEVYVAAWDANGLKRTATGHITFNALGQRVEG